MPGGIIGSVIAALGPVALLICALVKSRGDNLGGVSAFGIGLAIAVTGMVVYWAIGRAPKTASYGRGSDTANTGDFAKRE